MEGSIYRPSSEWHSLTGDYRLYDFPVADSVNDDKAILVDNVYTLLVIRGCLYGVSVLWKVWDNITHSQPHISQACTYLSVCL